MPLKGEARRSRAGRMAFEALGKPALQRKGPRDCAIVRPFLFAFVIVFVFVVCCFPFSWTQGERLTRWAENLTGRSTRRGTGTLKTQDKEGAVGVTLSNARQTQDKKSRQDAGARYKGTDARIGVRGRPRMMLRPTEKRRPRRMHAVMLKPVGSRRDRSKTTFSLLRPWRWLCLRTSSGNARRGRLCQSASACP